MVAKDGPNMIEAFIIEELISIVLRRSGDSRPLGYIVLKRDSHNAKAKWEKTRFWVSGF